MNEHIAVFGLGKLGAVLAAVLADKGFDVTGCDVNPQVCDDINAGRAPVNETGLADLMKGTQFRLRATTSPKLAVAATDMAFVIVPTPSRQTGFFSNDYVFDAVREQKANFFVDAFR